MADIALYRGDHSFVTFEIVDPDLTNAPINLAGATIYFIVKKSHEDADSTAIINVSSPSGVTIVDITNGIARANITPAMTLALTNKWHSLVYTAKIKDSAGNIATVSLGSFVVRPTSFTTGL